MRLAHRLVTAMILVGYRPVVQRETTAAVRAQGATWVLILIQATVAAAYGYGVVAYLTTDAEFFPEHAPPAWALPAVYATFLGPPATLTCILVSATLLRRSDYRSSNVFWRLLAAACTVSVAALITMVSPLGLEIFDWYVS
ncbi:hypothetical protein [Actinoplanes aureus]|uniref:Uncharacterized protein n=1 Tax=Actinoplanes aureus TaxID=2792083 RepID=A0A931CJW0_9ACTN|nr:hypothetical protein [Actinoplanes aureus]MBG0568431.1 hypothetical protein [Actinoplanes aureus]